MSYFDDNEDYLTGQTFHNKISRNINYNQHLRSTEYLEGYLKHDPESKYTPNGKFLSKVKLETEDGIMDVVAWEDNAEILNDLSKGDKIIIDGYRKLNNFLKREEFIIKQFIKRN